MKTSFAFGNLVFWNPDVREWFISATGEQLTTETYMQLVCPKCKMHPDKNEHDPCIANLPGVDFACCGHGVKSGYIKFTSGITLRGTFDHMQSPETVFNKEG